MARTGRFDFTQYLRVFRQEPGAIDDLLAAIPRIFREGTAGRLWGERDAFERACRFLAHHWNKLSGLGRSPREIAGQCRWLVEALSHPEFQRSFPPEKWRTLVNSLNDWSQETVGKLDQIRSAIERSGGAEEAVDFFHWLLRREFGEVADVADATMPKAQMKKLISVEALLRHHPDFRREPIDPDALRRAREAADRAIHWERGSFPVPGSEAIPNVPEFSTYGRALERGELDRLAAAGKLLRDSDLPEGVVFRSGSEGRFDGIDISERVARHPSEIVGDLTSGKKFNGNFPHIEMAFRENGIKFGQITHGDATHIAKKYMRLMTMDDYMLHGALTQAIENLKYIRLLDQAPFDACRRELARRSYLFIPANQVDGMRVLIAGHPDFSKVLERTGLTADEALERIRAIAAFPGSN